MTSIGSYRKDYTKARQKKDKTVKRLFYIKKNKPMKKGQTI